MATKGEKSWPKNKVASVECRKRDLVIRVANWLSDKEEPAYDVECYINGIYDWHESESFTLSSGLTKEQAKQAAIAFAQAQTAKLLK